MEVLFGEEFIVKKKIKNGWALTLIKDNYEGWLKIDTLKTKHPNRLIG